MKIFGYKHKHKDGDIHWFTTDHVVMFFSFIILLPFIFTFFIIGIFELLGESLKGLWSKTNNMYFKIGPLETFDLKETLKEVLIRIIITLLILSFMCGLFYLIWQGGRKVLVEFTGQVTHVNEGGGRFQVENVVCISSLCTERYTKSLDLWNNKRISFSTFDAGLLAAIGEDTIEMGCEYQRYSNKVNNRVASRFTNCVALE